MKIDMDGFNTTGVVVVELNGNMAVVNGLSPTDPYPVVTSSFETHWQLEPQYELQLLHQSAFSVSCKG